MRTVTKITFTDDNGIKFFLCGRIGTFLQKFPTEFCRFVIVKALHVSFHTAAGNDFSEIGVGIDCAVISPVFSAAVVGVDSVTACMGIYMPERSYIIRTVSEIFPVKPAVHIGGGIFVDDVVEPNLSFVFPHDLKFRCHGCTGTVKLDNIVYFTVFVQGSLKIAGVHFADVGICHYGTLGQSLFDQFSVAYGKVGPGFLVRGITAGFINRIKDYIGRVDLELFDHISDKKLQISCHSFFPNGIVSSAGRTG